MGRFAIAGQQQVSTGEVAPTRVHLLLSGLIVTAIAVLLFVNQDPEPAMASLKQHEQRLYQLEFKVLTYSYNIS